MVRWLLGGAAAVVFAAVVAVLVLRSDFMDLEIYRWGGSVAFDAGSLYALTHPTLPLQFTYPPFAALVFAALGAGGLLAPVVWTLLSLAALVRASWLMVGARASIAATLLVMAGVLAMEPAVETLRLGQVNFVLLWLVLEDLVGRGAGRATSGVRIGVATALKLTPGIYLVLLAITGRLRALLIGAATVLVTIGGTWLLLQTDSKAFWTGTGFEAGRTGAVEFLGNQSLNGVIWRLTGEGGNRALWIAGVLVLAGASLLLARRAWRMDLQLIAIGLAGLAGLFASPISWTHHWVMVAPLLVGLVTLLRGAGGGARVAVGAVYLVFVSRVVWRAPERDGAEFTHSGLEQLIASSYPLAGIVLLIVTALALRTPQNAARRRE